MTDIARNRQKEVFMKIATMATGGIGGFLAVKLDLAGHEVATIARGHHLAAIRENGLTLNGPQGPQTAPNTGVRPLYICVCLCL